MPRETNHPVCGDVDPPRQGPVLDRFRERLAGSNVCHDARASFSASIEEGELQQRRVDGLASRVEPDGRTVVIETDPFCIHWRGAQDVGASMINGSMGGAFSRAQAGRRAFLSLRNRRRH